MDNNNYIRDITVCIKNFMRNQKTRECYDSWQARYPGIKFIIIDDTGKDDPEQDMFYDRVKREGSRVLKTAFDIGLSSGRNMALEMATTPYVLIIDNDHFAYENTHIDYMYKVLESRKDLSIAGGKIFEDRKDGGDRFPRYDGFVEIQTSVGGERILKYEQLNWERCNWQEIDEVKYTQVDITHNFLLIKRSVYPVLKWNDELKICGEHADYALEAKGKGFKYVFVPDSIVFHNYGGEGDGGLEYEKFRSRAWHLNLLARKWGLHMAVNFWGQIHVYDRYNEHA